MKTKAEIACLAENVDVVIAVTLGTLYRDKKKRLTQAADTVRTLCGKGAIGNDTDACSPIATAGKHFKDMGEAYDDLLNKTYGLSWQDIAEIWKTCQSSVLTDQIAALVN
ncbi:MAG: hypothetical protein LBN05_08405 [Oscillospiraceae bacterium]|jgi:hypothetical protein|nr:hypothetical protein [Oscillospiraceae bacterium]